MSPAATVAPSQKSPPRAPPFRPRRSQHPPRTLRSPSQASFAALHRPDARLCRCAQPLVTLQPRKHSARPWVRSSSFLQDQLSWPQHQPIPPPGRPHSQRRTHLHHPKTRVQPRRPPSCASSTPLRSASLAGGKLARTASADPLPPQDRRPSGRTCFLFSRLRVADALRVSLLGV